MAREVKEIFANPEKGKRESSAIFIPICNNTWAGVGGGGLCEGHTLSWDWISEEEVRSKGRSLRGCKEENALATWF